MNGGWWAFVGGVVTALAIGAVQQRRPDVGFVALLGVGLLCGAVFNVAMFVASKTRQAAKRR